MVCLKSFPPQFVLQFERLGFFTADAPCEYVLKEGAEKDGDSQWGLDARTYTRPPGALPVFNLTVGLLESFTVSKEKEEEARKHKEKEQEARRRAAEERQRKKELRESAKLKKDSSKNENSKKAHEA